MKTAIRSRWPEVRELFERALEVPSSERAEWVQAQANDHELREAVLAMLADEQGETLASEPHLDAAHALPEGATLGRYRILRTLGRGGMGVVYLAEQLSPKRLVAIKLIAGRHDGNTLSRFRREADTLALLSHPGIAQVVEVDADDERPFLVMEYVDGRPLAEHAATLDRTARLELLARIAEAIAHAHERGVVHRDLKPSNILVTEQGQPKIVDFGIASLAALGGEALTETGMLLGTPAYMSPEQAQGHARIDARADVYSLAVIGYELLTDRLPLPVAGLTPLQALRALKEDTPQRLSRIDRTLRGDLETIFAKAMAKERELRYPSAGAFADDLRRFLASEPIHARRPGTWRRLVLFGRRNPMQLGLALAVAVSLVAGIAVSLWFARGQVIERERAVAEANRASDEAQRATQARSRAEATLGAIRRMFSAGNPVLAGHADVTFREVLASSPKQLADVAPEARGPVLYALAEAQSSIGEVEPAIANYFDAMQLGREAGDERLRLRASLRRAQLLQWHGSRAAFAAAIEALLADPAIGEDPLVHVFALLLSAREQKLHSHAESVRRQLAQAEALWPVPADAADAGLLAEAEVELTILRVRALLEQPGATLAVRTALAELRKALPRLQRELGAEHPRLAELRTGAHIASGLIDARGDALADVVAEVSERIDELGPAHPAILARLEPALDMAVTTLDAGLRAKLFDLALISARALPVGNRWRLGAASGMRENTWGGEREFFTIAELLEMSDVHCPAGRVPDLDCITARQAASRRLVREQRVAEALALCDRTLVELGSDGDRGFVATFQRERARVLRLQQRFDEAAAATDAAIAALAANGELSQQERDGAVLTAAWGYRPRHCARVLELIQPIEARLLAHPMIRKDSVARLMATCEARAAPDPERAIARLDAAWHELGPTVGPTNLVRGELISAYLEVYDVLGRDEEFARWAREMRSFSDQGLSTSFARSGLFPWIDRAMAMTAKDAKPAAPRPSAAR